MKKSSTTRRARLVAAALVVAAAGVFASVGVAGFGAKLVGMSHKTTPTGQQYPAGKVTICHHTHSQKNPFVTITVSQNAVPAHVRNHGDTIGPCPQQAPVVTVAPGQAKKAVKVHKAHKAKHKVNKGQLRRESKSKTKHESTQANKGVGHKPMTGPSTVHGKSQGKGQAKGHSKTHGPPAERGSGQGNGNGHDKGQKDQGQGHGQENGHSNTPGSGGNGKGKGP
jgi:hypothetical protein